MEKIFAKGFSIKRTEGQPSFVIGRMSVKVSEAIEFLKEHAENDWVSIDIKESAEGKIYCQLNTWKPTPKGDAVKEQPKVEAKAEAKPEKSSDAFAKARQDSEELPF